MPKHVKLEPCGPTSLLPVPGTQPCTAHAWVRRVNSVITNQKDESGGSVQATAGQMVPSLRGCYHTRCRQGVIRCLAGVPDRYHVSAVKATAGDVVIDGRFTLATAWARYEAMWLPLLCAWDAARDETPPAAPLDAAVVWLAHLSRPAQYAQVLAFCLSDFAWRQCGVHRCCAVVAAAAGCQNIAVRQAHPVSRSSDVASDSWHSHHWQTRGFASHQTLIQTLTAHTRTPTRTMRSDPPHL